jgi:hypothetical protein
VQLISLDDGIDTQSTGAKLQYGVKRALPRHLKDPLPVALRHLS